MTDLKTKYYRDMTEEEQAKWIAEWLESHDADLKMNAIIDGLMERAHDTGYDEGYEDGYEKGFDDAGGNEPEKDS